MSHSMGISAAQRNHINSQELLPPQQILATIVEHQEVAQFHFKMKLRIGAIAQSIKAGQFVHVLPRPASIRDPLLRRAFSVMSINDDSIEVLYRVMGLGTTWLSHLKVNEQVDLLCPLGNPFAPLSSQSLLVGGGVGVPPLVMLASTRTAAQNVIALIGARSQQELIGVHEFAAMGVPVDISTDDGGAGHHGRVTALLEARLDSADENKPTVFSCGPFPMLKAVADICQKYNTPCQVSLEENMPCGVGICNGCVVPVTGAGDDYGRYRRICVDGPVVWANEIDWGHLSASAACY